MKSALSLTFIVSLLASALPVTAQEIDGRFEALRERLKPGGTIFVTDRQGRETSGTLKRLLSTSLVILGGGDEREIRHAEIGRIEKPDSVWDGAVIGAALGGFSGTGAGASCSPNCASAVTQAVLVGGLFGAAVGAFFDRQIQGRTLVYGARPDSPHALHPSNPVSAFDELWMRVNRGDTIFVLGATGRETTGKLLQVSASSIALLADGQLRDIPVSQVREVTRRGDRVWTGVLVGAAVGAIGGAMHACQYGSGPSSSPDPVGCAIGGVGTGALIGGLIPRRIVVYRSADAGTTDTAPRRRRIIPIITPHTKAVALALSSWK